jgi:retron-type reverse transcriptase
MKQPGLFDPIIPDDFTESLFHAYFDCRRNKRNTLNALKFELHFEKYIFELADDIRNGTYQPGRSIAFIVTKPVKREVFAAQFRDRVVHHWLIRKLNPFFENAFMEDSYACRIGKGTHFGIRRMRDFIQECALENEGEAYVLKLDIRGFFMHISRHLLFEKLEDFISKNDK